MNKPNDIIPLSKLNLSHWQQIKSSSGYKEYIPKLIDINPDQDKQYNRKWSGKKCLLLLSSILLILLILSIILCSILIPIFILQQKSSPPPELPTTTTTINLPTIRRTTSLINCVYPFVLNNNGRCVNILIDSNNCGSIGNQCLTNSTCSAGICQNVPGIQLNNSIPIWSAAINGSVDDQMFNVTLPWSVTLYSTTTDRVIVTSDGVLCLGPCSTTYTESRLPSNAFGGTTAFPFWDDLYIYAGTSQGIYYESQGNSPKRKLIFEYYMSHYIEPNQYYHFQVIFFENLPGIVQFIYFDATDGGDTCEIGVQNSPNGPFMSYSYDQLNSVQPNLVLTFNTNLGTFNRSFLT